MARADDVLVVGSAGATRSQVAAVLTEAGFPVRSASHGEAFALCEVEPPRVVVVLTSGPAGSADASVSRLSCQPSLAHTALVALVPGRDVEGFLAAVGGGAAACLPLPVEGPALSAVTARLLEWSPPAPEIDRRGGRRRRMLLDVEVSESESGRRTLGQMVEASRGGCRVDLPLLLEPGRQVRIVVRAYEEATRLSLAGEVCWAQKRDDGPGSAGVRFSESTPVLAARELGFADDRA